MSAGADDPIECTTLVPVCLTLTIPADSDAWHAVGERLQHACLAVESASYCPNEWPEPDDSHADITPRGKNGCRGIQRFDTD